MKRIPLVFILLILAGCAAENVTIMNRSLVVNEVSQSDHFSGTLNDCRQSFEKLGEKQSYFKVEIPETTGSSIAPLYLILDIHTCDSQLIADSEKYLDSSTNLYKFQNILASHGAKMSLGVTKRYAELSKEVTDNHLKKLSNLGMEVTLHIHDDYLIPNYLGMEYPGITKGQEIARAASVTIWENALKQIKEDVESLSGTEVIGFSGAPWMPDKNKIASELGLTTIFNYKDASTHQTDDRLTVLNPWRPLGFDSINELVTYDRTGTIIFIPSGVKPAHCTDIEGISPFSYGNFDYATTMIIESLEEVDPKKINVIVFTIHPWDFETEEDFQMWDDWLTKILGPSLESGRLRFSNFREISKLYEEWEEKNIRI